MIMISSTQELKEMVRKALLELRKESPEVFTDIDSLTDALVKRLEKYFVTKTEFAETIDKVMAKIDARFDAMDKRFDAMQKEMDRRFEESNRRFEALQKEMDRRFDAMQKEMDRRFELVDKRFEAMQKEMDRRFDAVQKEISDIKTTLHHWTSAIEEDAQEVIKYYLNKEGIIISMLSNLQVAKDGIATEIDVYGANEEYCVIGEATVNLTDNKFDQLEDAIKNLKKYAPEKLRPKIIRVLFADRVYPEAIERARKENIWLIKAGKELVPLKEVLQKL
jgi:exonuclease VII large subunit